MLKQEQPNMFLIVTENLIEITEIRVLALAFLLWVSMYSVHWICSELYNNKFDIFNIFKKKKKKSA
jgi:hypothetical protein